MTDQPTLTVHPGANEGCGFTATDPFTVERPGREPWPGQVLARRLG